ncbi:MAG TPA: hypothetical protein VFD58_16500 [Blastocatellia bacterium]|nr:hypothetical protein [Blastocatellia bacterium]
MTVLNVYGSSKNAKEPKFPKTAFSPQVGFAWDVFGNGKTSVRGGFYLSYEMNIFNNTLFDEFSRIPPGIGPTALSFDFVVGPDGKPIDVGGFPDGDYSALQGQPIRNVLTTIGKVHQAVQSAYSSFQFDPKKGPSEFENSRGVTFGGTFPGTYEIPYSMQFTIGIQRELFPNHVISVDYVRNRGIGLPFLLGEFERRRDARYLNAAAAAANIASFLTNGCQGQTINQAITNGCLNSQGKRFTPTIANFGQASDAVFTGLTPNLTRARLLTGGFSLYQGIQVQLNGRLSSGQTDRLRFIKGLNYTISYALARAEATNGSGRTEFINNTINNNSWNSSYGPTGNDRTSILGAGVLMDVPMGFRLSQLWSFRTAPPQNLFVPFVDGFSSSNAMFTTDLNGSGGAGSSPQVDLLPGTNIGDFGRSIKSWKELNQVISNFNSGFAGKLTPNGQALVAAGLFTEAQLRSLGATIKPIKLVPESNPWPFENFFNLDLRISRPIKVTERFEFEPSVDIFNVFNNNSLGLYGGLAGNFGDLNFDYSDPADKADLNKNIRLRQKNTRLLQFGLRITF